MPYRLHIDSVPCKVTDSLLETVERLKQLFPAVQVDVELKSEMSFGDRIPKTTIFYKGQNGKEFDLMTFYGFKGQDWYLSIISVVVSAELVCEMKAS